MPSTDTAPQPRTEMVSSRCTEAEKRKIKKLASIKDTSESELLRSKGVLALVEEYDRMIAAVSESEPVAASQP